MHQSCAECGRASPDTETNYTLIDSAWRLTRERASDGLQRIVWRCPSCWKAFKSRRGASGEAPPASSEASTRARPKVG
jgi:hypothetical protein